jgi:hypothetical protein
MGTPELSTRVLDAVFDQSPVAAILVDRPRDDEHPEYRPAQTSGRCRAAGQFANMRS